MKISEESGSGATCTASPAAPHPPDPKRDPYISYMFQSLVTVVMSLISGMSSTNKNKADLNRR